MTKDFSRQQLGSVWRLISGRRRTPVRADTVGVALSHHGLSVARVTRTEALKPTLVCGFRALQVRGDAHQALNGMLTQFKFQQSACNFVLAADEYQLMSMAAPEVPEADLRDAMRWQLAEQINFPADEAVIEMFNEPEQIGQTRSLNVVVCRPSVVSSKAEMFDRSGGRLESIDIVELALCKITALLEKDKKGVLLIHLEPTFGVISITLQGTLYLTRRIKINAQELVAAATLSAERDADEALRLLLNDLALELRRSLDFYERRFSQPPVAAVYLLPFAKGFSAMKGYLEERLALEVHPLDLNTIMNCPENLTPELQARCLLAVGGAMRNMEVGP